MDLSQDRDFVLLIHGTGAAAVADAGEAWWQSGSAVWLALDERFENSAQCDPNIFHWSGRNSEHDRRLAASSLLDRLRELEFAHRPYHLIGHSHGGSVIWLALQEATASGLRLKYLQSWATLGTPFLNFRPQPIEWWRFLPLLVAAAVLIDFTFRQTGYVVSPWNIWKYFSYVPDLWQLGDYGPLVLYPLLWLGLLTILLRSAAYGWLAVRSRWAAHKRRGLQEQAYQSYRKSYLGVWSPNDEAINGLNGTLLLHGDVTPKWQANESASVLLRGLDLVKWPFRKLYNGVFAQAVDELIWSRVATGLQGNDTSGFELSFVARTPSLVSTSWPPLPYQLDQELVARANENAVATLASVRNALGLSATAGPNSPNVITGIAAQINFRELVHTSYYTSAPIQELLASHVASHSAAGQNCPLKPLSSPELKDWYSASLQQIGTQLAVPPAPLQWDRIRTLSRVEGLGLATAALVTWVALAGICRSSIDPLTDEYQVESILTRSQDVVPSIFYSQIFPWLQALVADRQSDRASRDALRLHTNDDGERVQALAVIATTLRSLDQADQAAAIETQAFELAGQVADSQSRARAIAALACELASHGVLREDMLQPHLIDFSTSSVLVTVAKTFATSGYPDLALKVLPADLAPRDYANGIAPILTALLGMGQNDKALELAKKVSLEDSFFTAPLVIEAYAATGDWAAAEKLALGISNEDARTRSFARLALLWIKSGNPSKSLEAAGRVESWQYVFGDAAETAAALAKAGQTAEAKKLAVKAIQDIQSYDNPWWNVQKLIENQQDLLAAGVAAEFEAARTALLQKAVQQYGGGKSTEVLGRAVISMIEAGDPNGANAYVRSFPSPEERAAFLPMVSAAFQDAQQPDLAREALLSARTEIETIDNEAGRSDGYAALIAAMAHAHQYRSARLLSENLLTLELRLNAYASILKEYAIQRNPPYKSRLADPDTLIVTDPF